MTATAIAAPDLEAHPHAVAQLLALSKRAIIGFLRQGPLLLPPLLFPLIFVAINASSFEKSLPLLKGIYPQLTNFLTFALASAVIQGVLFGGIQGATDLATDIEGGFFDRMVASPTRRWAILAGRLAGSVFAGAVQALFFALLLWAFGAKIRSGVPGVIVIVISGAAVALAFGALLASMAVKTGSAEAVQSSFPLVFVLLFASSTFFPRETMHGWFRTLADWNPISHLCEGLRELVINGWSASSALKAIVIPLAIAVVGIALSMLALRRRLANQ